MRSSQSKRQKYTDEQLRKLRIDVTRISDWEQAIEALKGDFLKISIQKYRFSARVIVDANKIVQITGQSFPRLQKDLFEAHQRTQYSSEEDWLTNLTHEQLLSLSRDLKAPDFARIDTNIDFHYLLTKEIESTSNKIRALEEHSRKDLLSSYHFSDSIKMVEYSKLIDRKNFLVKYRTNADLIHESILFVSSVHKSAVQTMNKIDELNEMIRLARLKIEAVKRHEARDGKAIAIAAAATNHTRKRADEIKKFIYKTRNCPYCDIKLGITAHLDHIYPVSKGGLSTIENLVWCCSECNIAKSDKGLYAFLKERNLSALDVLGRLIALGKHI